MADARGRTATWGLLALGAAGASAMWLSPGGERAQTQVSDVVGGGSAGGSPTAAGAKFAFAAASPGPPAPPALPATIRIAGRVTLDGAPRAATIALTSDATLAGALPERIVVSGGDGRFDLGPVPAGAWQVTAIADGATSATADVVTSRADLALPLGRCRARAYGVVVDERGAAVAGAAIGVAGRRAIAVSDAGGRWSACVAGGVARIEVRAPGRGAVARAVAIDGAARVDVALAAEAVIAGRVRGPGAAGAIVIAEAADGAAPEGAGSARAIAGPDGGFELHGVGAGRVRLRAIAAGAIAASTVIVEAAAAARVDLREPLALEPPVIVRGTVRDAPAAHVAWRSDGGVVVDGATDDAGGFALAIPRDSGRFVVDGRTVVAPLAIDPAASAARGPIAVALAAATRVRGRVVRGGAPVAGALIAARGPGYATARTAIDGRFELALEKPGRWQLVASSDDLGATSRPQAVRVAADRRDPLDVHDVELAWGASIAGAVVDAHGAPVAGVVVLARDLDEHDFGRAITGIDGRFRCDRLSGGDGVYELRVVDGAREDDPIAPADPEKGFPTVELADGGAHADGVRLVIAADPDPMPPAAPPPAAPPPVAVASSPAAIASSLHVTARGFATPPPITVRRVDARATIAESDGGTLDAALDPGTYLVQASAGARSDARTIAIAPGRRAEVVLVARAPAHVRGQVVIRPAGVMAGGFTCVAAPAAGAAIGTGDGGAVATDDAGRFAIDAPSGDAELRCFRRDGAFSDGAARVRLAAGATASLAIPVVAATTADAGVTFELTAGRAAAAGLVPGDVVTAAGAVELAPLSHGGAAFALAAARAWTVRGTRGAVRVVALP